MSKTFVYTLLVIGVYVVIIFPKLSKTKKHYDNEKEEYTPDTQNGTGLAENADENGVSKGASGQMKYRIGYTK